MSSKRPVNRILEILKFERKEISAIYFYAILAGLVQLTLPLGIQSIISFVLGGSISTSLVLLITLVVFGVFVNGLLQVNQMKIIEKIQQQLFVRYSFLYAYNLQKIDLKGISDYYLPELVNRFFDVISLQKGISKLLLDIPTATIQIVFGLILLSFYHPAFILFGLLLVFILYIILQYTGNRGLETSIKESTHKYRVAAHLEEIARMSRSYKFIDNSFALKKADIHVSNYLEARTSHFKILLIQYWSLIGFKLLITAAMLIVGAVLLVNQQLNIGQFIAAEIVIILVINSVEKLIVNLDKVYDVLTSLEKINVVLEKPLEGTGSLKYSPGNSGIEIKANSVSFTYGERDVLEDINLEICSGEKIFVEGMPGSGKSSLLYILSGIYQPTSGEVTFDNVPLNNYLVEDIRKRISVLFSESGVISGSIMNNIMMGRDISYDKVDKVARITGLREFVAEIKDGYDRIIQPSACHLPDDIIQKILLTRALLTEPKLLLMDTPFKGLSAERVVSVLEYINTHMKDTTVVIADTSCINKEYFNKVIGLSNGKILNSDNRS
ncbi:MAG: ATP-binding cassette domain-containing protein [Chitinophagales bacterium]|nr:ATP-binding cassette domain-containing protein [Chitinophagales bacterium]